MVGEKEVKDASKKTRLSAVVIAQDVALIIERCLKSLSFADEIVVVDANSEDATADLARACGARVIAKEWSGFARQKQFAIDQAQGEWVFLCDSDEEVPEALGREILEVVSFREPAAGYRVRRRNQFLGEWMEHGPWTDDRVVRLFRKNKGGMSDKAVHEGLSVDGEIRDLKNQLYHYTHATLSESFARLNRYTTLEAGDRAGRRRISFLDPFVPPLGVFLKYYVRKGCWRDGMRGFLLSAVTAMYKSVLYVKIYILQRSGGWARRGGDE